MLRSYGSRYSFGGRVGSSVTTSRDNGRLMIAANKETNAQAFCDAVSVKTQKSPAEKTAFCDKLTTRLEKPQAS